jgi:two-component system sensor histidine kinase DesK
MLLAVALAGLGMAAVRQLTIVNTDLHAARSELAELAVTAERERLARELHDVLGRTLSLIAVKAELGARLSGNSDAAAGDEMRDVQRLAREALREVRQAVSGDYVPSLAAELAAAPTALQAAGIAAHVSTTREAINPAHTAGLAWALREAVTNVVRHSGARTCWITLQSADGLTTLEVTDDGRGPGDGTSGTGLEGLTQRIEALGGTLQVGRGEVGGFRLLVALHAAAPRHSQTVLTV